MRFLIIILVGISFFSCEEQTNISSKKKYEEILNGGNWKFIESEKPFKEFQAGLKFSEDKQVFDVDSQGQIVIPLHERIYSISSDTLKIIDARYVDRFLHERGTLIFIIKELNNERIVLNVVQPEGPNKLIFDNLN